MEHFSRSIDFPAPEALMRMVPNMPNYHELQHFSVSMDPMSFAEPMPYGSEFSTVLMANSNANQMNSSDGNVGGSISMSIQPGLVGAPVSDVIAGHDKILPLERKSEMGHAWKSSVSQQEQLSSESTVLRADGGPLGSVQSLESQRKTRPVQQHNLGSPASQAHSALVKRKAPTESSGKSGAQRGRPAKKQTAKIDSATKPQSESSDAVRSKMRESLAAALALASQKPGSVSTAKKDGENTITHQIPVGSQSAESNSMMGGNVPHTAIKEMVPFQGSTLGSTTTDSRESTCEFSPKRNFNGGQNFQEVQFNSILPDGDAQFSDNVFVKDDLLQGHGLSWAVCIDAQMEESGEAQNGDKPPSAADFHDLVDKVPILIPENIAFKIEAELFKLYGGINKKYREKGRSLLFNLKDHKNPELRERVMSGKISPERLCSMSAEELASKELSEWRIAKAEELAQMVVLPDTEIDMRRLVKKTHKGEYQVEFEHNDGIADEVSSGSSMHAQLLPKKEIGNHSPNPSRTDKDNVAGQEKTSDDQEFSGSLIIPTDGTDLMQGMMVDEFKDTSSLPPIVSLDEFMESLNSEPPFENISEDAARKIPLAHEVSPKAVSITQASRRAPISPRDAPSKRADVGKKYQADMTVKSSGSEKKVLPSRAVKVESIWEGVLQLNISSFVAVCGLFQSGEKTSTKEWSTSVEIKGRVRLDAFEKFLQELPKSRSRALMVMQFVLKDESSETQLATISEAVDSYTSDERLGFAEPAAGVELYICPRTPRIAELLNKHLPKESRQADNNNNAKENGLIGVVVWRRTHVSPNSSSHHKHSSKKQPFSSSNRLQDSPNANGNVISPTTRASAPVFNYVSRPKPEPEEDDDIPPGFGPADAKDEDDLPEFNFSGGFNSFTPSLLSQKVHRDVKTTPTPADHVRELIKRYGQSDAVTTSVVERRGLRVEGWDDDDDIPEWQPEAAIRLPAQPVARGSHSLLVNRQPAPGGQWRPPHRHVHGARWKQQ